MMPRTPPERGVGCSHSVAERLRRQRFEAQVGPRVADAEPRVGDRAVGETHRAFGGGTRLALPPTGAVDRFDLGAKAFAFRFEAGADGFRGLGLVDVGRPTAT